jgi:hypothetical protein
MRPLLKYFPGMTIVALYAHVSTKDKGQSTEKQLPALRRVAKAWPWLTVRSSSRGFSGTVRAASRKSRGVGTSFDHACSRRTSGPYHGGL